MNLLEDDLDELIELTVDIDSNNLRIDRYLSDNCNQLSRSYIQRLIKDQMVLVNEKTTKANYKVSTNDLITIMVPEPEELNITPEPIDLDILYEDSDLIVINKPKGMVVHPAPGHYSGTLVNGLLYHCKNDLSGINGTIRPGIVHRIDRDTTGVLVVAKNDRSHASLSEQLKEHTITRRYHAIVHGTFHDIEGTVEGSIGRHPVDRKKMAINVKNGKSATTHYKVLEQFTNKCSYIECQLETGRTHQIRVHMASIHHPLLGDDVYGPAKTQYKLEGQTLHAKVLGFLHPTTKQYMEFEAPLPDYFQELLTKFRKMT